MIDRYIEDGISEDGFALFSALMRSGIGLNDFRFAGAINACADHVAEVLEASSWLHDTNRV
jgi:TorA maturation chaperone TorD